MAGWLGACARDEQHRWIHWFPVGVGFGIAVYFALKTEPWPWLGPSACAGTLAIVLGARRRAALARLGVAGLAVALGFAAAQLETARVATVFAPDYDWPVEVEGRILHVEPRGAGVRLLLDRITVARWPAGPVPERVRLVAQGWRQATPSAGDRVRVLAVVGPPPAPAAPGAFDFARQAFFERLGGVGFVLGGGEIVERGDPSSGAGLWLEMVRQDLAARFRAALPVPIGAVAAALLVGERAGIPDEVNDAMRDSGLFHLLSISGLHLAFVAGLVFFAARAGLALIEPIALRYPIKKWAAAAAIVASAGYLALSGAAVPTQRAFLMTTVVLLAVLIDRSPFSMRLVALAATGILIVAPDSLLGASFQLSFAAVVALIAVAEEARDRSWLGVGGAGIVRRAWVYVAGVALTSFVAGTATAPIAAYHFDRYASYGVIGNLVAVPITGAWVMPWGLVALGLAPFGAERFGLIPMGWGIEAILATARVVAAWPGAALVVPAMPFASLVALIGGGLWLTLWRRPWRWLGAGGLVIAAALWAVAVPPDVLVDGEARFVAVRGPDGRLAVSSRRAGGLVAESWLRRAGQTSWSEWPRAGETLGWLACDAAACIYRTAGWTVAIVRDPAALAEECANADVLIALGEAATNCRQPRLVIDRRDLARRGAHAVWLGDDGARVETVAESRGSRPWTRADQ